MAVPSFHIAVDGPAGTTFPSFPSSTLEQGDPTKIVLGMIRNKCRISNKLFFTADGKSRINDETTLAYYMSLTVEGQEILHPGAGEQKGGDREKPKAENVQLPAHQADGNQANPSENARDSGRKEGSVQADTGKLAPGVRTLSIKVTDGKIAQQPLALPAANETLSKLLESISGGGLERGKLPTFSDRQLASLSASYATNAGTVTYPEPAELTEQQWDSILMNNRAFHGYWYDYNRGILVKASKRAFRLSGAAPLGKPPANGEKDQARLYVPPVPPFFIHDDATVSVTEIRSQFQHILTKEGFNSIAVEGSIKGGPATVPISVSESFDTEHASAEQKQNQNDVSSLVVTYNFPRVVVELDPECLELTEQCKEDAMSVVDKAGRSRFYRQYGTIFASRFTLGGYLHSTRNVTSTEKSSLDQVKDKTRIAAGISIQTPKVGGGFNIAKVDSKGEEDGTASLYQDARLTWDAHGGDTLLCSNPPAWANTVKDYRLWRLMNQERLIRLDYLIKDVDLLAYKRLDELSPISYPTRDVTKDKEFEERVRTILMEALAKPENNKMAQKMEKYYRDGKFDTAASIEPYNKFMLNNFPDEKDAIINARTLYGGTNMDQRVGFGLYMTSKEELQF